MLQRLKKTIKRLFFPMAILFMATSFAGAYFSDTVAVSGNSFETGSWGGGSPPPEPTAGIVEISEVFYDAIGIDTGFEWVELYNRGGSAIDLTGYDLYVGHYYTIPSFSLGAGNFVVIHINASGSDIATELYEGSGTVNMGDTSASVALFSNVTHNSSTIVDFVEYGAGGQIWQPAAVVAGIWTAGDFVADVVAGHSIELNDKSIETNQSGGWHDQSPSTPGS